MTYYYRFTPALRSSTTEDAPPNPLLEPADEDWTAARGPYSDQVWSPPSDSHLPVFDWTGIYLEGWVGVPLAAPCEATTNFLPLMVRYKNLGPSYAWVFWCPLDAGLATGLSTNSQYQVLLPGDSTVVYARWVENLYDRANLPGALGTHSPDWMEGATVEVTVVQMDIDATLSALGLTAA